MIFAPEIHRLEGRAAPPLFGIARGRGRAQASGSALALARERGERSLELRASTSLARLLLARGGGRRGDAQRSWPPIHDWFAEGFDTADLDRPRRRSWTRSR